MVIFKKRSAVRRLSPSGFGRHLAVAEDYRKGKAYVFASTHNNTSHTTTLTRFTLTETEIQPAEVLTTYESFDELGQGEIQISPDGKRLSVYNHKERLGFFAHQEVEVLTFTLSTDFEVVEENNLIENNRTTVPYGNLSAGQAGLPKGSVEFTQTSDAVYFNQEALVNFAENNTTNKLNYKQSLKDEQATLFAYLPEMNGDVRRSADGKIYFFNKDADNAAVFADDITFTGNPSVSPITVILAQAGISLSGALSHQPHRVFDNTPVTITARRIVGSKQYQHSDHLGNVRVVYSDVKIRVTDAGGQLIALEAEVESYTNYYSFGMAQPGRNFSSEKYRYGFNGKEKDTEWNSDVVYDYGFRIYDPRLARFLSVDPLFKEFAYLSTYQFAGNMPTIAIDLDGLEQFFKTRIINGKGEVLGESVEVVNSSFLRKFLGIGSRRAPNNAQMEKRRMKFQNRLVEISDNGFGLFGNQAGEKFRNAKTPIKNGTFVLEFQVIQDEEGRVQIVAEGFFEDTPFEKIESSFSFSGFAFQAAGGGNGETKGGGKIESALDITLLLAVINMVQNATNKGAFPKKIEKLDEFIDFIEFVHNSSDVATDLSEQLGDIPDLPGLDGEKKTTEGKTTTSLPPSSTTLEALPSGKMKVIDNKTGDTLIVQPVKKE